MAAIMDPPMIRDPAMVTPMNGMRALLKLELLPYLRHRPNLSDKAPSKCFTLGEENAADD
jgi:hypothetical protein